tara:strand:+ start:205 stop:456 length:252 start_codon:yes stop_codon:yes gene_type:complete
MTNKWKEYPAPEEDIAKLNERRSDLVKWVIDRFHILLADGREDDACEFMEEWSEWVDPQLYINESTVFFDENELKEHYKSAKG